MSKSRKGNGPRGVAPTFENLLHSIQGVDAELAAQAKRAVNVGLTLRNWLIGHYIAEYEQNGADRARYGAKLLENLSESLAGLGVSRAEERELQRYRHFYQTYPQIRESATPGFAIAGKELISRLSFTHIVELLAIQDPIERAFYERECLRGNWSVRELKRQIASLYFERSGLSQDNAKLAELAQAGAEPAGPGLEIRDPYIFEFLGLKPREVMSESHLEAQLKRLDREEGRLIDAYQAEVISLEELGLRRRGHSARRQALAEQRDQQVRLRQEATSARAVLADLQAFCDRIRSRLEGVTLLEKQEILQLLIERVIVGEGSLEIRHVLPLRGVTPIGPGTEPLKDGLRSDGMDPASLGSGRGPDLTDRLPEPQRPVADRQRGLDRQATSQIPRRPFRTSQNALEVRSPSQRRGTAGMELNAFPWDEGSYQRPFGMPDRSVQRRYSGSPTEACAGSSFRGHVGCCDSLDGSGFSLWPDARITAGIACLDNLHRQFRLAA